MFPFLVALAVAHADSVAAGRVVRIVGGDTVASAGAMVVLHRVSTEQQGAIDSVRADAAGAFAFRFTAESGASYLVSARWSGLEYFAPPLLAGGNDGNLVVMVADTAATAPVVVAARHLVVSGPAPDGTRTVVDLVILRNTGSVTRIRPNDTTPTWRMAIPPHIANLRVAESDFAADAFDQHGDTLLLFAPVPPGERQIFLDYQIAPGARDLVLPVNADVLVFNLMTEDVVRVDALTAQPDTTVNDRRFQRWTGRGDLVPSVSIRFAGSWAPAWLGSALAAALASILVAFSVVTLRRRTAPATRSVDNLVDAIAALDRDARHRTLAAGAPGWDAYLRERAALKAELARRLPT